MKTVQGKEARCHRGPHSGAAPTQHLAPTGEKNFLEDPPPTDAVLIGLESNAGPTGTDVTRRIRWRAQSNSRTTPWFWRVFFYDNGSQTGLVASPGKSSPGS